MKNVYEKMLDAWNSAVAYMAARVSSGGSETTGEKYNRPSAAPEEKKCWVRGCGRNVVIRNRISTLCELHNAKEIKIGYIIEGPAYSSLDEAAMAAANIILYHVLVNGSIEYGIGIYHRQLERDEYYLVETRLGNRTQVLIDDETAAIGAGSDKPKLNDKEYTFKAHVHSHPIYGYQKFSIADYMLSCGGGKTSQISFADKKPPYPMYLVGCAWFPGFDYEKDEIVTGDGKLWLAEIKHTSGESYPKPGVGKQWKRIKDYKKNRYSDYEVGDIVYDFGQKYPIWEKISEINEDWKRYAAYEYKDFDDIRRSATLTKFTPPIDSFEAQRLAIILYALFDSGVIIHDNSWWKNHWDALHKQYPKEFEEYWATQQRSLTRCLTQFAKPSSNKITEYRFDVFLCNEKEPQRSVWGNYEWATAKRAIRAALKKKTMREIIYENKGLIQRAAITKEWKPNENRRILWKDIRNI